MKIAIFEIAGGRFALPQEHVLELAHAVLITPLPNAPAIIEGLVDVRGVVAPVLDLRRRFGLPAKAVEPAEHLVIARAGERTVAVRADRVLELAEVPPGQVVDSSRASPASQRHFGVVKMADGLVLLHDLGGFLSQAESEQLAAALRPGDRAEP